MPQNVEIQFGTEKHLKILTALIERKRLSQDKLDGFQKVWNEAEEFSEGYIKTSEADRIRTDQKKSRGKVDYTTIEVPYSYGMMMSAHTYISSVFLGRRPVNQWTARHGEPQQSVMAVEALTDYQTQVGGHLIPYTIWIYDALQYGLGVVMTQWEEDEIISTQIEKVPKVRMGVELEGETEIKRTTGSMKGYVGNRLYNVKPYDWLPDPRVSFANFQQGEFCGRLFDASWNDIVEGHAKGNYFNLDAMKRNMARQDTEGEKQSAQVTHPDPTNDDLLTTTFDLGFMKGMEMTVRLVPKDWGLGSGDRPEKWLFVVGNERVIISARPQGHHHGKFPFSVLEQEIEGYKLSKRGMPEMMRPMNNIMSWLFNSHFYNVRASLNNQFIFDPSRVTMKDMLSTEPGLLARLRPEAYGTNPKDVIHQLSVGDVTGNHLNDLEAVGQLSQRAYGVVDNVMGMVNPGGRKTATEVRTSSSFAVNRLKTIAEYMSAMGWEPLSMMNLQQTQQYYDQERKFKIVGDLTAKQDFVSVDPKSIAGFYDFVPVDGTMPIDRFAQANLFKELLQALRQMPEVAQAYDIPGMFAWIAQLAGMRNVHQFKINATQSAGALQQQAQAGNVIPMSALEAPPVAPQPGQIPNVGPTK